MIETTQRERGLWFGVLAAPLAWAAQLVINETFPEWFSCTRGFRTPGEVYALSNKMLVALVDGGALLVALVALMVSLAALRRLRASDPTPERRALWMATAGVINSAIFAIPIVLGFLPAVLLNSCRPTP